MDKNNTEARSPCIVQLVSIDLLLSFVLQYCLDLLCRQFHEDQRHEVQEKEEKDQKMVSLLPRFDDLFLKLSLLFTLNECYFKFTV